MSTRDLFRSTLDEFAAKAKVTLPDNAGRIDAAVALVLAGDVTLQPDGTAVVGSATQPMTTYSVNGTCGCPDHARAPQAWCKHRLARALQLRLDRAMQDTHDPEVSNATREGSTNAKEPTKGENASTETSEEQSASDSFIEGKNGVSTQTVPPEYVVWISGHPFVRFAGLLQMAHAQHLVELSECWTHNDESLSLAHAVAIFEDGRRFEGSGDSSPANVGKKVALHWRRVSLTRAKSRALRDALNCAMVAVEDLVDHD